MEHHRAGWDGQDHRQKIEWCHQESLLAGKEDTSPLDYLDSWDLLQSKCPDW